MTLETTPRYGNNPVSEAGDHAIVVGGSMAGLLAARVLADAFRTVSIIEKDRLPAEPNVRKGVPQAGHIHALHEAGRVTLDDLFPGYEEDLTSAGGLVIDMARDLNFYDEGDFVADGQDSIPWYMASRPLFEHLTRQRLVGLDDIIIRDDTQFIEYLTDSRDAVIEGVVVRNETGEREELAAELVVDATGRTSRTPGWLEDHGYESPEVHEVEIDIAYSSIQLERDTTDPEAYLVMPCPPRKRGAAVFPIEDGRWLMTVSGVHGDHPPTDLDGLADFVEPLPVPVFARLLGEQEVVSGAVDHHPFPSNRKHHYWELDRFPEGLVVIGDAVASFNPIYGQGMSVAGLEALHLLDALADSPEEDLALRFFDSIETVVEDAWSLAVGTDFRFPETTGPKPPGTAILNRYFSRFTRKAHSDAALADIYGRVVSMERRPTSLLRPGVIWRVLKPTVSG